MSKEKRIKEKKNAINQSSKIVNEIFTELETITNACIEEEYSREYGFSPRYWFNITKFKKKLAKLKKKYSEDRK